MEVTLSKRTMIIIGVVVVLTIPGAALAVHIYTDVVDGSVHAPGIEWMAGTGITVGCGDGSTYCPGDPVTRGQMGTFFHRLSGNAPGIDPSVNAATLEGLDSTAFLGATGKAADSDLLDGLDSTAFLGATDKAADSDLLDGLDSTAFLGATDQAADSALLDGQPPSHYLAQINGDQYDPAAGVSLVAATPTLVATTGMAAPEAGLVLLTYYVSVERLGTDTEYRAYVQVDDTACVSPISVTPNPTQALGMVTGTDNFDTASGSFAVAVSAGAHSFTLCGYSDSSDVGVEFAGIQSVFATVGSAS